MNRMNPSKTGAALGVLFGGIHLVWSVLVGAGLAQPLVNFVSQIHMVKPVVNVVAFDMGNAVLLVVVTALVGYVVGFAFALAANSVR